MDAVKRGELGQIVHVEVMLTLDLYGPGSRFTDPNVPHPAVHARGGFVSDFITHLAYLVHAFIGSHRTARSIWTCRREESPLRFDEFRAMIDGERGTGSMVLSANGQPDGFWLRAIGTNGRAKAGIWEDRLVIEKLRPGRGPLTPVLNALSVSKASRRGAWQTLSRKLSGGGSYEGLWELVKRSYDALSREAEPPISLATIEQVNRLADDLIAQEPAK
jgi:predicted dehydrogenase